MTEKKKEEAKSVFFKVHPKARRVLKIKAIERDKHYFELIEALVNNLALKCPQYIDKILEA